MQQLCQVVIDLVMFLAWNASRPRVKHQNTLQKVIWTKSCHCYPLLLEVPIAISVMVLNFDLPQEADASSRELSD